MIPVLVQHRLTCLLEKMAFIMETVSMLVMNYVKSQLIANFLHFSLKLSYAIYFPPPFHPILTQILPMVIPVFIIATKC